MADAVYLQILDGIIDALNDGRPSDIPEVTSRRVTPGEKVSEPSMAVFLGDETVDPPRSHLDTLARRRMAIAVQCIAPAEDTAELDRLVEPMLKWSAGVLGKPRRPEVLKGLVLYLRETELQRRATVVGDVYIMAATQIFECSYTTRRDDLTVPT